MRHFAKELRYDGYALTYFQLDEHIRSSFESIIEEFLKSKKPQKIIVTSPSEYRVLDKVKNWSTLYSVVVEIKDDKRFLCSKKEFQQWSNNKEKLMMEYFYRHMRKKYKILMDGDKPVGGKWNYDKQNRKIIPRNQSISEPRVFEPDNTTQKVIKLVNDNFIDHFGTTDNFRYAVTRADALKALDWFIENQLPFFGDYQDAMLENKPWLFHSILSPYINIGLILPLECISMAVSAYEKGSVPINAIEGYIRQILGWREYVNGIYWLKMPEYKNLNTLKASKKIPDLFWNLDTDLNCLRNCLEDTQDNAYAHHIQRLMVLGNFCLLIGVHPDFVNEWYLIVYADAYEWVEMPNVSGMILYADGGLLGSKPYAASGSYINKMSDYCKGCRYKVEEKNGPNACPFNYLYWYFLDKNKELLKSNHRMKMIYSSLGKMSDEKIKKIREDASKFMDYLYP
jgi:deoxyribodipyrimidine photolyase-related protein